MFIHFPHSQGHSVASPFTARPSQLAEGLYLYIWALNPTRPMPRDDPENVWQARPRRGSPKWMIPGLVNVHITDGKITILRLGKSTISMAIFNS